MVTTRAFVLRTFKHGDSATILKAYTEHAGTASYLVRPKSKKHSIKALLQPLNLLELVVDERAGRDLHYVKDLRCTEPFQNISNDMGRSTVALFMQEVLYKVLREEAPDPAMFSYLIDLHRVLDNAEDIRLLPVLFLVRLSEVLGLLPEQAKEDQDHFDVITGQFRHGPSVENSTIPPPLASLLNSLLDTPIEEVAAVHMAYADRRALVDHLLVFFRYHIEPMGELRSPDILHSILV